MEQPEGFVKFGKNGEKLFCKLRKSLYGLKQSGRIWNNMLHNFLLQENFQVSFVDSCVYSRNVNGLKIIVIIWVDDIIIAASNEYLLHVVKDSLCQKFKMKDLGKLSWFLGIEFKCNTDCIEMTQIKYVEKILSKFEMSDCKPKSTPCDLSVSKVMDDDSEILHNPRLYREIVGSLIYIMTATRPDLCYIVTKLSQHMSNPTKAHLGMAKHVLRYLKV